jgi:hypothetical protein
MTAAYIPVFQLRSPPPRALGVCCRRVPQALPPAVNPIHMARLNPETGPPGPLAQPQTTPTAVLRPI